MPNNDITKSNKIGSRSSLRGFAGRVASQVSSIEQPTTSKNRIGLLLDNSGSMGSLDGDSSKTKIDLLKDAVQGFVGACSFADTSLALYAIPVEDKTTVHMTNQGALIILGSARLDASGDTPLGASMLKLLENESLTRCLIVSDGESTDSSKEVFAANQFKDAEIPCDCLHIGSSSSGENTLKRIAETTGGLYLKFKDVGQFAKAMYYLTPKYAALLQSANSSELSTMLGADEVRK